MKKGLFENIVITTDFSPVAGNSIKFGLKLASFFKSRVTLLNVYEIPDFPYQEHSVSDEKVKSIRVQHIKKLERLQARCTSSYPELNIKIKIECGFLNEVLDRFCSDSKATLVIMGTKGASGLKEYLIGTNTALVLETLSTAVLVVPAKASFQPFSRIVFASDFHKGDVHIVKQLLASSVLQDSKLEVIHFSDGSEEDIQSMKRLEAL